MSDEIINRVAKSPIVSLDIADYFSDDIEVIDIKPWLFQGLLLKEQEFRTSLAAHDWNIYSDKVVAVYCSADAIVPQWAYMLIASYLDSLCTDYFFGSKEEVEEASLLKNIASSSFEYCRDKPVIVKGCGNRPIPNSAYMAMVKKIKPLAKNIMFGEACSSVPIFKKKK